MDTFDLIRTVLDEIYMRIPGNDDEKDKRIEEMFDVLSQWYVDLTDPTKSSAIDYSDPVVQFAYIYRYTTAHANLVYRLIEKNHSTLGDLFNKRAYVTAIGGGPGSELLGILKYKMLYNKMDTLRVYLYDKEMSWAESWVHVDDKLDDAGFNVSTVVFPLDVTKQDTWATSYNYLESDLFTMIYFLSEVYVLRDDADAFFSNLFAKAKAGSYFLFADNKHSEFSRHFDSLIESQTDMQLISSARDNIKMDWSEQKDKLGDYYKRFDDPKLTCKVVYRVYRKNPF